jgi:hypothetical protein
MVQISMTDFVDFVISSGSPKLTKVRQVKGRGDYDPATDFWRPLRDGLVAFHANGGTDKAILDRLAANQSDTKKVGRYGECVKGYKKFLGRKHHTWFTPSANVWVAGALGIRVNPELGLELNGRRLLVKLYFKSEDLSKRRADLLLELMDQALGAANPGVDLAVLDVPRGKLFTSAAANTGLLPLLLGEAASFSTMWQHA